jgi:hypothetical protein
MGEKLNRCCVLLLLLVSLVGCQHELPAYESRATDTQPTIVAAPLGPVTTALQTEIAVAVQATQWPALDPSMESVIAGPQVPPELGWCGHRDILPADMCTWGTSPTKAVLVGDSIAMTYADPLREIALAGPLKLRSEAMFGCVFTNELISNPDQQLVDACPARKQHAVDVINDIRPALVIIASSYGTKTVAGTDRELSPTEWAQSTRQLVDQFRGNVGRVVFLAAPPADKNVSECFGERDSSPAACLSTVTDLWRSMAEAEQALADDIDGLWIDSRPWFCNGGYCPSFVATTPTKRDAQHMSAAYGRKIRPAINEAMSEAGLF